MYTNLTLVIEKEYFEESKILWVVIQHPITKVKYRYIFQGVERPFAARLLGSNMIGKHYFEQLKNKFKFTIEQL